MLDVNFSKIDILDNNIVLSESESHRIEMTQRAVNFCDFLESKGISYDYCFKHPEVSGCVDYHEFDKYLGDDYFVGKHLLLQERKGDKNKYLVIADSSKKLDFNALREKLDCRKLEFVKEEDMESLIHTTPGNVSIFNMIYDVNKEIQVVIDQDLLNASEVAFHPLYNGMSIFMKPEQCFKFLSFIDREAMVIPIESKEKMISAQKKLGGI